LANFWKCLKSLVHAMGVLGGEHIVVRCGDERYVVELPKNGTKV